MARSSSPVTVDTELVGRLRLSVARLARLLRQQDESGFTPTMTAVLATIGREGPLTLGELATREQVAPPTITKLVGRLDDAGLIERHLDPADRRVCRVALSPAGRDQLEANRSRRNAWLADRIDALSPEDRDRLTAAVEVIEHLTAPEGGSERP